MDKKSIMNITSKINNTVSKYGYVYDFDIERFVEEEGLDISVPEYFLEVLKIIDKSSE